MKNSYLDYLFVESDGFTPRIPMLPAHAIKSVQEFTGLDNLILCGRLNDNYGVFKTIHDKEPEDLLFTVNKYQDALVLMFIGVTDDMPFLYMEADGEEIDKGFLKYYRPHEKQCAYLKKVFLEITNCHIPKTPVYIHYTQDAKA